MCNKCKEDNDIKIVSDDGKKVKFICNCGKTIIKNKSAFQKSKRCKKCAFKKFTFDYDYVFNYFKEHDCELLEKEYKNARTPMEYICSCKRKSKICFDSFKKGNRCRKCGNEKAANKQKLSQEEVTKFFDDCGCILLDKYENPTTPMRYTCHCKREGFTSWSAFRNAKHCKQCGIDKRKGKNNYQWIVDRELKEQNYFFKQKCYKLLKMTLRLTKNKKNNKTAILLGYDNITLKNHIINHPNWEKVKYDQWHIDHIFPITAFIKYGITDISIINSLDNLQPLNYIENISKSDKYDFLEFKNWLFSRNIIIEEIQ